MNWDQILLYELPIYYLLPYSSVTGEEVPTYSSPCLERNKVTLNIRGRFEGLAVKFRNIGSVRLMEVTHSPSFFVQTVTNYAMYIWYSSVNDDEKADLRGLRAAYNTEMSSASTIGGSGKRQDGRAVRYFQCRLQQLITSAEYTSGLTAIILNWTVDAVNSDIREPK